MITNVNKKVYELNLKQNKNIERRAKIKINCEHLKTLDTFCCNTTNSFWHLVPESPCGLGSAGGKSLEHPRLG